MDQAQGRTCGLSEVNSVSLHKLNALTSGSHGKLVHLHSRTIACVSTASVIWCYGHTIPASCTHWPYNLLSAMLRLQTTWRHTGKSRDLLSARAEDHYWVRSPRLSGESSKKKKRFGSFLSGIPSLYISKKQKTQKNKKFVSYTLRQNQLIREHFYNKFELLLGVENMLYSSGREITERR